MKTPLFEAHVTRIHYGIEVSIPLHIWLECGGMKPNGFPPDGSDPKDVEACDRRCKINDARAERIFEQFDAIRGISHVEYNGHFGPYVYFACEPQDAENVMAGVRRVLRVAYRQMVRSAAYKQWCAANKITPVAQ